MVLSNMLRDIERYKHNSLKEMIENRLENNLKLYLNELNKSSERLSEKSLSLKVIKELSK